MRRGSRTPLLLCQRHSPPNRQRSRRDLPHRQGHDQPNGLWLGLLHASHHCTLGSKRRSCNDLEPKSNCKQNVNLSQLSNNIQSDTKANTCLTSCCKSTKASSLTEGVENMNLCACAHQCYLGTCSLSHAITHESPPWLAAAAVWWRVATGADLLGQRVVRAP